MPKSPQKDERPNGIIFIREQIVENRENFTNLLSTICEGDVSQIKAIKTVDDYLIKLNYYTSSLSAKEK